MEFKYLQAAFAAVLFIGWLFLDDGNDTPEETDNDE